MSTKLYIAGPMSGLPEMNYPAFNKAAAILTQAGYEVFNPVDNENLRPADGGFDGFEPWQWFMRRSLEQVARADAIALLPGWEKSKGATLEHHIATALSMPIKTVENWQTTALTQETK